jgi:SET domain-containing protein
MNHSCDPTAGIRLYPHGIVVVAIRPIRIHDEITFDYSTYLNNPYEQIACRCRTSICRGVIGNFSTLSKDRQERYLALRVVSSFVHEAGAADGASG